MFIRVALNLPTNYLLDYNCIENVLPYQRVLVPLGKSFRIAFIVEINIEPDCDKSKIKDIFKILDAEPLLDSSLQKVIKSASEYYQTSIYNLIKISMPRNFFIKENIQNKKTECIKLSKHFDKKLTAKQRDLVIFLQQDKHLSIKKLEEKGISKSVINTAVKNKIVNKISRDFIPVLKSQGQDRHKVLNQEQELAFKEITASLNKYTSFLLYGVTGSGKTEVYLQVIDEVIKKGKQALVLIPEINLTPQTLSRFKTRFNEHIVVLHSKISQTEKSQSWYLVKKGVAKIVISTRSGVLFDFKNLGVIIVDEEHDRSFKQQSGLRYSARNLAVLRASMQNIPIVLGSATPSLDSYYNSKQG